MTFTEYLLMGFVCLLILYVGARLATAAYFQSKQHYEKGRKHHGL